MGALSSQVVPIAFTQGLDTRTQQKLVIPGKWTDLLNLSLSTDNTPRTRDGHSALVGSNNGNSLFTRGNELLSIAGPQVSSISPATSSAILVAGVPGYVGISKTEVQRSTGMQDSPDCASSGSLTCYVWRAKSALNVTTGFAMTIVDELSGTNIQANVTVHAAASSDWIRVVATSDAFFIVYRDGNNIFCRVVAFTAPAVLGAETAIVTSANVAGVCAGEACAFGTGVSVMLAYGWTDGVTSVRTLEIIRAGTVPSVGAGPTNAISQANLNIAGVTAISCCAFSNGTDAAVLATGNAGALTGLVGSTIDQTWAVTTTAGGVRLSNVVSATTSPNHLCAVVDGPSMRVFRDFLSELSTNSLNAITQQTVDVTMATIVGTTTVNASATFGAGVVARGPQGPFIHAKPFASAGTIFLPVFVFGVYNNLSGAAANPRTANTQNTLFIVDCGRANLGFYDTPAVCGRALYGTLGLASINGNAPAVSICSTPSTVSSSVFAILAGELTLLVLSSGNNVSPTGLVRLTLMPNTTLPLSRAALGESAYVAGGQLSMYDGQSLAEQGFPLFPEGMGVTAGGAGTGTMTDGVHQVVVVYAWVDNAGQRHLSAPSLPVTVTVNSGGANTGSILVNVPTLLVSQKAGVEILVYSTIAASLSFFRANLNAGAYTPVANTTAATTVNFRVSESDAALASNEALYTQPNQAPTTLANIAPAPCTYVWTAHRRLWFDKADKPGWFGYSQEYVNNVGLQFAPDLEDSLPAESGGFVAGAEMDEKVVIFGRRRIYVMFGSGPNSSGSFNNYSHPQDIQADLGCSDPMSILAEVPQGIIFKAQKGWHLLGRDLSVKYIGEGVAQFDTNSVTAAVMLEDRKECRFVTAGSAGGVLGTTLVFSYLIDQWSYFSQTNGDGYSPVDAAWWPVAGSGLGRYVTISTTAGTNQDTPGVYTDQPGGSPPVGILTRARTSWLHLSKLEGFQRVRWLYFSGTASGATPNSSLQVNVDYDDEYGGTAPGAYSYSVNLFTAFFPWTGASIDVRSKMRRMKCKSIAVTFTEGAAAGVSRLAGIQALALELGMKKGVNRLPAVQSVG